MKKLLIITLTITLLLLLVACTKTVDVTTPETNTFDPNRSIDGADADGLLPQVDPDEMDRYASYEVEVVCSFAKAGSTGDGSEMLEAMIKSESLLAKYGFEQDQVDGLIAKYKEDPLFLSLAEDKIQEQCPEEYAAMNAVNETAS